MRHAPVAFTLIELLVVVTIIVVLLAMLAPAMDKAIYSAELAVCGGNLKGDASGVATYAMGFKRRYPYRPVVFGEQPNNSQADEMPLPFGTHQPNNASGYDDRPYLDGYVNLKGLVCPLAGKI